MKRSQGFTLLEVLIALGIVSVISILSWQGLEEVLRSAGRVNQVDEQIQIVNAVFSQLEKDVGALELSIEPPTPESDLLEVSGSGLLLQFTQRNTSEPAYRERVEWVLDNNQLLRIARRELNPDQPSVSEPISVLGMQVRLLREPGGWSSPITFGNHTLVERTDLELQGPVLHINSGGKPATPPSDQDGSGPSGDTPAQPVATLVRAVEVSITQPNRQAVTRVILTGGVY